MNATSAAKTEASVPEPSVFEALGGRPTLQRVHRIFYDKLFSDPWIGQYFKNTRRDFIESQQTDFMTHALGGPKNYFGAFPIPAHKHMNISDELFSYRHQLLKEALREADVPSHLAEKWLRIDASFRKGLVKPSIDACEKRYGTDEILDFQRVPRKS